MLCHRQGVEMGSSPDFGGRWQVCCHGEMSLLPQPSSQLYTSGENTSTNWSPCCSPSGVSRTECCLCTPLSPHQDWGAWHGSVGEACTAAPAALSVPWNEMVISPELRPCHWLPGFLWQCCSMLVMCPCQFPFIEHFILQGNFWALKYQICVAFFNRRFSLSWRLGLYLRLCECKRTLLYHCCSSSVGHCI